jgi:hypothetical protein
MLAPHRKPHFPVLSASKAARCVSVPRRALSPTAGRARGRVLHPGKLDAATALVPMIRSLHKAA